MTVAAADIGGMHNDVADVDRGHVGFARPDAGKDWLLAPLCGCHDQQVTCSKPGLFRAAAFAGPPR